MKKGPRCSVKGCRREAWYVLVDGYLDGTSLLREEVLVYPLCDKQDGRFHKFATRLKVKADGKIPGLLRIRWAYGKRGKARGTGSTRRR